MAAATIAAIVPADRLQLPGLSKALLVPKAVSGNTRWVTVACKFSDIAEEQKPVTFFNGQYGTRPGQLGHYWKEVSYNKINLTGSSAYGWFTLPQPRSFYVTTVDGEGQGEPRPVVRRLRRRRQSDGELQWRRRAST